MSKHTAELKPDETLRIWPTHWAGGCKSWTPNRIRIESDALGVVAYVEHHGAGSGNDIYPTQKDYAMARLIVDAVNQRAALLEALKEAVSESEAGMSLSLGTHAKCQSAIAQAEKGAEE